MSEPEPPVGPLDALRHPRYAGIRTFARLPELGSVGRADVAVLGAPFDGGASFRPGARFGPAAIREAALLLRPYNEPLDVSPFAEGQVADAGDAGPNPFDLAAAHAAVEERAAELHAAGTRVLGLGGDHSTALPLLRAAAARHGALSLLQLDAHTDTWDEYFGAKVTHGTFLKRAVEEGAVEPARSVQVGLRGPLYSADDYPEDRALGFATLLARELDERRVAGVLDLLRERLDAPVYVTVDIDVLDPAFAPGTGTPEPGGLTTRELLAIVRGLAGLGLDVVAADVVEVSPPYDAGGVTAMAAAAVAYDLIGLMVRGARAA
jgi:agmatinase